METHLRQRHHSDGEGSQVAVRPQSLPLNAFRMTNPNGIHTTSNDNG
jgi:hypothetical protein